jgi:hypothetical protein
MKPLGAPGSSAFRCTNTAPGADRDPLRAHARRDLEGPFFGRVDDFISFR